MKGFVLINGYPSGEKFYRPGERIAVALRALGVEVDVYRNGEVYAMVEGDGGVTVCTPHQKQYHFAVYLDKDKYLGKLLEEGGLKLFNSATSVELCDDKMQTYLSLLDSGLHLAESIAAPLCYTKEAKPNTEFLARVGDSLGFPLVAKKSYGSFGEGVQLIPGMPELIKQEESWLHVPHFYQRYISQSQGRDIRAIVIGGKAVAAMERVAQEGEFRSNIELGGTGRKTDLQPAYQQAAERAAQVLGLEYCGVDLLETKEGPIVCEVNSNAFFEGLENTTGIDVAALYAKHIYESMHTAIKK